MVADELRRQADNFIDLVELKNEITKIGGQSSHPQPETHDLVEQDDDANVENDDDENTAISDPKAYLETT
jgi:hypothetical protein